MIKSTDNKRKEIEDKQHRKITEFFLKKIIKQVKYSKIEQEKKKNKKTQITNIRKERGDIITLKGK